LAFCTSFGSLALTLTINLPWGYHGRRVIMPVEKKPVLRLLYDSVCRNVFSDQEIVVDFISSVIDIPAEEFEDVSIEDPNILGDYRNDKSVILDVRIITKSGHCIDIEIQRALHKAFVNRTIFNNAKNLTTQMERGNKYDMLRRSISIIITDFELFEDDVPQHRFMYYDVETQKLLSDIVELNYLELPKTPKEDDGNKVYKWMRLFSAREEEEMQTIAEESPVLQKTVMKIIQMSEDEKARRIADAEWEQQIREDSMYDTGIETKAVDVAHKMKIRGLDNDLIVEITGLPKDKIEQL
jgi:predicted transposase/invertase (TIGR01784 family)